MAGYLGTVRDFLLHFQTRFHRLWKDLTSAIWKLLIKLDLTSRRCRRGLQVALLASGQEILRIGNESF